LSDTLFAAAETRLTGEEVAAGFKGVRDSANDYYRDDLKPYRYK
jgi:hypothetical protein